MHSPLLSEDDTTPAPQPVRKKAPRLQSLDVFRGLTIAWMILVDNAGDAFPEIDHCPWNGVALADFVMPNFDFIVGVSLTFSLRGALIAGEDSRRAALRRVLWRFAKIFGWGLATQGGRDFMDYELSSLRIMGILQRVACCYLVAALAELWLTDEKTLRLEPVSGTWSWRQRLGLFARFRWQWVLAAALCAAQLAILYGVDVPGCGRGVLTPSCNAAAHVDRQLFTVAHMYFPSNGGTPSQNDVTYQRMPECSSCSPGKCAPPPNAPSWCCRGGGDDASASAGCTSSFDPEGIVSTLTCVVAAIVGAHFGHVLRASDDHVERLMQWGSASMFGIVAGAVLHFAGLPLNTDLYSLSFLLLTCGVSGLLLCMAYVVMDMPRVLSPAAAERVRSALQPFRWLGLNAITMYLLAEGGCVQWLLNCFYVSGPRGEAPGDRTQTLSYYLWPGGAWGVGGDPETRSAPSRSAAVLIWVIAYIVLWMLVARAMHQRRIYIKL